MMGAANAQYERIKAFSETDFVADLNVIDCPCPFMVSFANKHPEYRDVVVG
jgi:hypothetical protein